MAGTTPDRAALTDKILSHAVFNAPIEAPIDKIDIAEWLRTLPDKEYQRCAPPDHKAAGYTTADDGRPMSINVEMIGTGLVVQHYVYEIAEKDHCHMVSTSDVLTPDAARHRCMPRASAGMPTPRDKSLAGTW
jgi:hypothetical protein